MGKGRLHNVAANFYKFIEHLLFKKPTKTTTTTTLIFPFIVIYCVYYIIRIHTNFQTQWFVLKHAVTLVLVSALNIEWVCFIICIDVSSPPPPLNT